MALVLKMQIDDKQEHQYIFSTGDDGTIELIPLNVVINGSYQAPEGKAYNLVTVEVPNITLEELNVVTSGTYTAPSGTAYDVVTVDIPEYIFDALTATENGTFTPESGHVYNRVVVNVPTPTPTTETKQVTYTSNGTYTVDKSANVDGMTSVTVTVNVPPSTPTLQTKQVTVTQNGSRVITADTGYDGLEEVDLTVNVSGGSLPSYMSFDTYTPSVDSNGIDVVELSHADDGSYLVAVYIQSEDGTLPEKLGTVLNSFVTKLNAFIKPDFLGTSTNDAGNETSTILYSLAPAYSTNHVGNTYIYGVSPNSSSIAVTITGNHEISVNRKQSTNNSTSYRGFLYGKTYKIYGFYQSL